MRCSHGCAHFSAAAFQAMLTTAMGTSSAPACVASNAVDDEWRAASRAPRAERATGGRGACAVVYSVARSIL